MKISAALLAILLGGTSCRGALPASRPVVASPETEAPIDGVVPGAEFHGIEGIWFAWEAWRNVLIRVRLEKKDLELALTHAQIGQEVAEIEARRLRESQSKAQWAATYGPWFGFAGGLSAAAIVAAILGGVMGGMNAQRK
jgi:hypothetical protein